MEFELRVGGDCIARFETAEAAETRARELVRANADIIVEIIDLNIGRPTGRPTGRPNAPAADEAGREALARKIGF
jgi:hypothetical protein